MAYHRMTEEEWQRFVREPVRAGVLATTRKDGHPHAAPVWYDLDDDGTIMFNTGADTVKGRAVRRDGRATLCVQDDQPPFSFVTIEGSTTWSDELTEVRAWAGRIGARYMGAERGDEYGARNGVPGELVVRLTPTRVVGFADMAD
ncbi:MAG TPA: PPOX class F420-dependent oxidoreductase [Acidimicrobiales bacterium]|nr:PPOX class F420-dependent oxidoreductase [Acidimicrobiales bacterium]